MRDAREWVHERDWDDLADLIRKVQTDAIEAAAKVLEDSEPDGDVRVARMVETLADAIRRLKPQ